MAKDDAPLRFWLEVVGRAAIGLTFVLFLPLGAALAGIGALLNAR